MSNPVFKTQMLALRLVESLTIRIKPTAISLGVGASGDPLITIGSGVSDGCNALIRFVGIPTPTAKDIFGNASPNPNTPNIVQVAFETGDTGMTTAKLVAILGDLFATGCAFEWYAETHTNVPTEATFAAAKLITSYEQNLWYQLMGQ